VIKLAQLDTTQKVDDLFQVCITLDEDGNGQISLDEFLHYFEHLEISDQTEFERLKAEEEMYENVWPEWVIKEGKIEMAKLIITRMFESLRKTQNISAEQAFQIFDSKKKGLITTEYFRKVLTMFFADARLSEVETEFVMKLTPRTVDQQCMYREFCKFLDKRFVRTFNKSSASNATNLELQKELDAPLRKEASLNYMIRKCFELGLDLRKIVVLQDQTNLNVISRARFQRMLENLPLGLLPYEIEEIFDNDLNFDNYGNVDYTVILNSDLFVTLERSKLKKEQLLKRSLSMQNEGAQVKS
jgi:Ca2+-binding EF-hand superfamily protein